MGRIRWPSIKVHSVKQTAQDIEPELDTTEVGAECLAHTAVVLTKA